MNNMNDGNFVTESMEILPDLHHNSQEYEITKH